ncbi:MAG: Gfo/Idh/MocA family oxidoreductase [Opitutaceae bacterium]|nr:Gfo/Idh/MocA family oxidoreductase [Opitutaceae bacterium]
MSTSSEPGGLRVGIAGYGVVGQRRRQFIDLHPGLRTVAVCDAKIAASGAFEDGVHYHPDYRRLLAEELDVLFVCVPNYLAADITIAGLERGLHVFCEKPPGRDLADLARVIECERQHPGRKLKYGFNHHHHDSVREARRIVASGELGRVLNLRGLYGKSKIISFESDWRTRRSEAGGGILLDQGIHMVDLMRMFAGEFTEVHSFVSNSFWNHDVEDNAYALMRTKDGIVAMLHSSATQWRHHFRLEITLARGQLILAGILSGSKSYGSETLTIAYASEHDGGDPREVTTRYNQDNSWRDEIAEFADAITNDKPVVAGSSAEALRTLALVYRIYAADPEWKARFKINDQVPISLTGLLGD